MTYDWLYYIWATLLLLLNAAAWSSSLLTLPGNWIMVVLTALFAYLIPVQDGRGISWTIVLVALCLAVIGELIEVSAGAATAVKHGSSRRAAFLAIAGAVVGGVTGAILLLPVFLFGAIVGAVGGGSLGAFSGAYLGEMWKGKERGESIAIGKAAMFGHVFGMFGKLVVGAILLVVVTVGSFL